MKTRVDRMIAAVVALMTLFAAESRLQGQANEWPLVFQNARFYLGIDVARLKSQLDMDAASDLAEIESMIEGPTGMPAADARKVALQFGADEFPDEVRGSEMSKSVGIVFSFGSDISEQARRSLTQMAGTEEKNHNDIGYYKVEREPCFMFRDDLLLVCEEAKLHEHLDTAGREEEPPVSLDNAECDVRIVGAFDRSGFGKFFAGIIRDIPCADESASEFIDSVIETASGFDVELNLQSDEILVINLALAEGKSIDDLKEGATGLVAWGRGVFRDIFESMDRVLPDGLESRDTVDNLYKRIDSLLASAEITEVAGGVAVTVRSEGGASDIANGLVRSAMIIIQVMNN
jgi:hypothetical protein